MPQRKLKLTDMKVIEASRMKSGVRDWVDEATSQFGDSGWTNR
jgi:hypothetical protein